MTRVRAREQARERQRPLWPSLGCGRARKGPASAVARRWQHRDPRPVTRGLLGAAVSGCSVPGPAEAPASGWGRQTPDADGLGALLCLDLASLVALLDGLPGDAERASDLGPGGAVAACCCGPEIPRIGECVLGVSHGLQGVQGSLWASQRGGEALDGATGLPAGLGPFVGRHVNGYCTGAPTRSGHVTHFSLTRSTCDTSFPNSSPVRVAAPISERTAFALRLTTEEKDPALRQQPGSWTTSGASDDDDSSLCS